MRCRGFMAEASTFELSRAAQVSYNMKPNVIVASNEVNC
jgi:hypothetical protein